MSKMRLAIQTVVVCICVLVTTSLYAATKMPSFALADVVSGETIDSSSFKGKSLLVTFFATWCPPCIQEVPTLIKLQNSYKDKGFSVIGLSVDQGGSQVVKKLVLKKSINYPVMMADDMTIQNFGGVYGIPVSFLVNKKGNVVKKYTGYIAKSILEKDIKKIL
jgi:thiol-disulfide isomerase/thioredoxin